MLTFNYIARDPKTGQKVKAEVQADSEKSAAQLIQKLGLSPIGIEQKKVESGVFYQIRSRIKTKEKIIFTRQLSTLINAGLPIVQSLRSVQEQTKSKPFQVVITRIISDIEAGNKLSDSLAKYPKVFNTIFCSLVASGEASGTLDKALERLAIQQEKDSEINSKVRGAMIYPVIVLVVMVLVVGFMLVKVLPQVQVLYDGIKGAQLPLITRMLLSVSNFVVKFWWLLAGLLAFAVISTSKWSKTIGGKRFFDKLKMKSPGVGQLFMKLYMARFARTGHTLVASGVPLLQMLEITSKSVDNVYIETSLKVASEKVKGGKALSDSIENDSNFLDLVPKMINIGEQSGSLELMLDKTAEYYEKEVDQQIKTISTIIEPAMMVVLGIVALVVVAAVLLPVYGLAGQTGFGG
jgi:type IV pilus assembly protein PilC